ncbi:EF-hand [Backusella circina FSU 941]|nr:EF-hand [Backusella circina FSU 941]
MMDQYRYLGITVEELDTLKKAFNIYDIDHNGYITIKHFTSILTSLNIESDPNKLDNIISAIDLNKDNMIDFNEFVHAMFKYLPHAQSDRDKDDELMACFQYFDKDKDGRISQAELEEVLIRIGAHLSPGEIQEMMRTGDINRDGYIDFDEFIQLLPPL